MQELTKSVHFFTELLTMASIFETWCMLQHLTLQLFTTLFSIFFFLSKMS